MKRSFITNILFFLLIIFPLSVSATGPSYLYAEINPVSVNEKGEVLCRTRFIKNDTGGHWYNRVEYGLCVITDGKIIEYKTKILDPQIIDEESDGSSGKITGEEYLKLLGHWDWIYKTGLDFNNLSKQQQNICDQYGFRENNAARYRVNKKKSVADFEDERGIDLMKKRQLALKEAKSVSYGNKQVYILYDFGDMLILENAYSEDPQNDAGAAFSYINPLFGGLEYEYYKIVGVLFLNQ